MQDAFEILGIQSSAAPEDIRAAYRALARRWHPDRFLAGPEREWAGEKMAQINAAYRVCLRGAKAGYPAAEPEELIEAQKLIENGELGSARELLMRISTRCAEWNYLFGELLLRSCEYRKAALYLSVAANQRPNIAKYAHELERARQLSDAGRQGILGRFSRR